MPANKLIFGIIPKHVVLININEKNIPNENRYPSSPNNDTPLCLPKLIIKNYEIQREESIKFLGVLL